MREFTNACHSSFNGLPFGFYGHLHTRVRTHTYKYKNFENKNSPTADCSGLWHWLLVSIMVQSRKAYSLTGGSFPFPGVPHVPMSLCMCRGKQALLLQGYLQWLLMGGCCGIPVKM